MKVDDSTVFDVPLFCCRTDSTVHYDLLFFLSASRLLVIKYLPKQKIFGKNLGKNMEFTFHVRYMFT